MLWSLFIISLSSFMLGFFCGRLSKSVEKIFDPGGVVPPQPPDELANRRLKRFYEREDDGRS